MQDIVCLLPALFIISAPCCGDRHRRLIFLASLQLRFGQLDAAKEFIASPALEKHFSWLSSTDACPILAASEKDQNCCDGQFVDAWEICDEEYSFCWSGTSQSLQKPPLCFHQQRLMGNHAVFPTANNMAETRWV